MSKISKVEFFRHVNKLAALEAAIDEAERFSIPTANKLAKEVKKLRYRYSKHSRDDLIQVIEECGFVCEESFCTPTVQALFEQTGKLPPGTYTEGFRLVIIRVSGWRGSPQDVKLFFSNQIEQEFREILA